MFRTSMLALVIGLLATGCVVTTGGKPAKMNHTHRSHPAHNRGNASSSTPAPTPAPATGGQAVAAPPVATPAPATPTPATPAPATGVRGSVPTVGAVHPATQPATGNTGAGAATPKVGATQQVAPPSEEQKNTKGKKTTKQRAPVPVMRQ